MHHRARAGVLVPPPRHLRRLLRATQDHHGIPAGAQALPPGHIQHSRAHCGCHGRVHARPRMRRDRAQKHLKGTRAPRKRGADGDVRVPGRRSQRRHRVDLGVRRRDHVAGESSGRGTGLAQADHPIRQRRREEARRGPAVSHDPRPWALKRGQDAILLQPIPSLHPAPIVRERGLGRSRGGHCQDSGGHGNRSAADPGGRTQPLRVEDADAP
mmetsp:Transcript_66842/g.211502  ORF Transcript_66842/g.211502 Transcript_66842/m.211502 type:complete len:213 (-) Transcript_66842:3303-3941(-)